MQPKKVSLKIYRGQGIPSKAGSKKLVPGMNKMRTAESSVIKMEWEQMLLKQGGSAIIVTEKVLKVVL